MKLSDKISDFFDRSGSRKVENGRVEEKDEEPDGGGGLVVRLVLRQAEVVHDCPRWGSYLVRYYFLIISKTYKHNRLYFWVRNTT